MGLLAKASRQQPADKLLTVIGHYSETKELQLLVQKSIVTTFSSLVLGLNQTSEVYSLAIVEVESGTDHVLVGADPNSCSVSIKGHNKLECNGVGFQVLWATAVRAHQISSSLSTCKRLPWTVRTAQRVRLDVSQKDLRASHEENE
jgi:hypothetical protein